MLSTHFQSLKLFLPFSKDTIFIRLLNSKFTFKENVTENSNEESTWKDKTVMTRSL